MSQELNLQASLKFLKGGASIEALFNSAYFDVAGSVGNKEQQTIGITDETLNLGDVGTIGVVAVKNLDATNSITIGPDGTSYPIKLKPLEFGLFRWNAAAIHAKSLVAPCILDYAIISD